MNTPTPDQLVEEVTQAVSEYHAAQDHLDTLPANQVCSWERFGIAEAARRKILPIIGAEAYREFLCANLPNCLDPSVNAQNISNNYLGDSNMGKAAYFVRTIDWEGLKLLLQCSPTLSPLSRLNLSIMNNGREATMLPATPDVTATIEDSGYTERHLYTNAMDYCNGCLVEGSNRLRPLGDAIIQFGVGALADASRLDELAQTNRYEYIARYLLGLPASLTDIVKKAIGK